MSPNFPNKDEMPDTEGKTVPPYEGRQEAADVDGEAESTKDGAKTAGATGPVEDDETKRAEPSQTPAGETASPADEQPASKSGGDAEDEGSTGPAHTPGTRRSEDVP